MGCVSLQRRRGYGLPQPFGLRNDRFGGSCVDLTRAVPAFPTGCNLMHHTRRGDPRSPVNFAYAKFIAARRKIRLCSFGKSEKLRFSAGERGSPLRSISTIAFVRRGWSSKVRRRCLTPPYGVHIPYAGRTLAAGKFAHRGQIFPTGRRGRRPLQYEFHTPSGS